MRDPPDDPDLLSVVSEGPAGAVLNVRVKPRSSRRGVLGVERSALSVGVGAAPEGGRATMEAARTVASWLGVPPSRITLVSGARARSKRFVVAGLAPRELRARIRTRLARHPR